MSDWLRGMTVLGTAFVAVLVATLGLAGAIAPAVRPSGSNVDGGSTSTAEGAATPMVGHPGIGGRLAVTGDLEGTFVLTGESVEDRYALTGNDGRITFESVPAGVAQLSYEGWEFFPEPDECTVTPLDVDTAVGIGQAQLECTDLADVRENGTISLSGQLGLPVDILAERTLPFTGGSLSVGHETWEFENVFLTTWQMPAVVGSPRHNLVLLDRVTAMDESVADPSAFNIDYDLETHALSAASVERRGETAVIPEGACEIRRQELGRQNARTTVIELSISCPEIDVPGLGPVPIEGTVVVDELAWPD